jgi:hypothetical protein
MKNQELRSILMHPAVSRAMYGLEQASGLAPLVRLRRSRRDVKAAARNMREEMAVYGRRDADAYGKGRIVALPPMPSGEKRLREALAGELPGDLRAMIADFLGGAKQ